MSRLLSAAFVNTAGLVLGLATCAAQASYVATIEQVGSNVVVSGSGSLDTSALTRFLSGHPQTGSGGDLDPEDAQFSLGDLRAVPTAVYDGITGPRSFGTSGGQADSGSGPIVEMVGNGAPDFIVPVAYVSGTQLGLSQDTFLNQTLASLGLTPGFYEWTWGSGATADFFSLQIGPADVDGTVAEPASIALLFAGAGAGLQGARRRRRKS